MENFIFGRCKGMPEYFSRIEPELEEEWVYGENKLRYRIYANIYKRTWYGAKMVAYENTTLEGLDSHEDAIQRLSKKAYNNIQNIYKKKAIVVKMLQNNPINNKLEFFAKKLTDLYQ